jgi:hypothetical protein
MSTNLLKQSPSPAEGKGVVVKAVDPKWKAVMFAQPFILPTFLEAGNLPANHLA